jgi:hypothetical protein
LSCRVKARGRPRPDSMGRSPADPTTVRAAGAPPAVGQAAQRNVPGPGRPSEVITAVERGGGATGTTTRLRRSRPARRRWFGPEETRTTARARPQFTQPIGGVRYRRPGPGRVRTCPTRVVAVTAAPAEPTPRESRTRGRAVLGTAATVGYPVSPRPAPVRLHPPGSSPGRTSHGHTPAGPAEYPRSVGSLHLCPPISDLGSAASDLRPTEHVHSATADVAGPAPPPRRPHAETAVAEPMELQRAESAPTEGGNSRSPDVPARLGRAFRRSPDVHPENGAGVRAARPPIPAIPAIPAIPVAQHIQRN